MCLRAASTVAAESRPCDQLELHELPTPCPSHAPHGVTHWDPVTLYAVSLSADKSQLPLYAVFVSRQLHLYTLFVAVQSPWDVAFVDTETHLHAVFVGLRVRPYVAFV
ncbi:hypothetical protein B0H19DRAFT_1263582 [Mycena capillaripes]|nr:hypothetical protein B0H19DRAFT_1263582 [Mycena capillaripes]